MGEKIWWKCNNCGYRFQQAVEEGVPDRCPSCKEACSFTNATCYTAECGGSGSGNFDPRI